ncbi:hypothetical protein HPB47_024432, partial [Ixodes persulcatus]
PNPDLTYLKLRAMRRKAQRRSLITSRQEDIQRNRKLDAAFRKHTYRLQRRQWRRRCESLHSPGGGRRAWHMARVLAGHAVPCSPALGLAVIHNITVAQAVEHLADEVTSIPAPPSGFAVISTAGTVPTTLTIADSDFTMGELHHALRRSSGKRSAPGLDGITFQALRNLAAATLDNINDIWRSSVLPPAWLQSVVVPIHKPGKPI